MREVTWEGNLEGNAEKLEFESVLETRGPEGVISVD